MLYHTQQHMQNTCMRSIIHQPHAKFVNHWFINTLVRMRFFTALTLWAVSVVSLFSPRPFVHLLLHILMHLLSLLFLVLLFFFTYVLYYFSSLFFAYPCRFFASSLLLLFLLFPLLQSSCVSISSYPLVRSSLSDPFSLSLPPFELSFSPIFCFLNAHRVPSYRCSYQDIRM